MLKEKRKHGYDKTIVIFEEKRLVGKELNDGRSMVFTQKVHLWNFACTADMDRTISAAELTKEKNVFQKIDQINTLIDHQQWEEANLEINSILKLYQRKNTKWQLPGNSSKYEQILYQLNKAIQEKDQIKARLTLGTIRMMARVIYTL